MTPEAEIDIIAFHDQLTQLLLSLEEMLVAKRKSYGASNIQRHGAYGLLVRIDDKSERLRHMFEQKLDVTAVGESMRDAWQDIAGYAILALMFTDNGKQMYGDLELERAKEIHANQHPQLMVDPKLSQISAAFVTEDPEPIYDRAYALEPEPEPEPDPMERIEELREEVRVTRGRARRPS